MNRLTKSILQSGNGAIRYSVMAEDDLYGVIAQNAQGMYYLTRQPSVQFKTPVDAFNAIAMAENWDEVAGYSVLTDTSCGTAATLSDEGPWMVESEAEAMADLQEDIDEGDLIEGESFVSIITFCPSENLLYVLETEQQILMRDW